MKTKLIFSTAISLASLVCLPSCHDKTEKGKSGDKTAETAAAQEQQAAQPRIAEPSTDEVQKLVSDQLELAPYLKLLYCQDKLDKQDDSHYNGEAELKFCVTEDLYSKQDAPACFNQERKEINDKATASVLPDSVYLLQVGAETGSISEEQRSPKAMPENLQTIYDELRNLAEASVYEQTAQNGYEFSVSASFKLQYNAESKAWELCDFQMDEQRLKAMDGMTPQSGLEEGARVLSPEFEADLKAKIQEKMASFKQAADEYIRSREGDARAELAAKQAQDEEAARKLSEQAAAEDARKQEWQDTCAAQLQAGKKFAGEWTRDKRFGELTLTIQVAKRFDNSVQFVGTIYDTKLPAASLDVAGRCDFTPSENGAKLDITIYDGQYDPDQPTAEVYDAKDGMLVLNLGKDGKLNGIMTSAAWSASPEKNINISLSPVKEAAAEKNSKTGKGSKR